MSRPPTFRTLGSDLPTFRSFVAGGLLSLSLIVAFPALMGSPGHSSLTRQWPSQHTDKSSKTQTNSADREWTAKGKSASDFKPGDSQSRSNSATEQEGPAAGQQGSAMPPDQRRHSPEGMDSAARHEIIVSIGDKLKQYYFDHELAERMVTSLRAHEKNGDYDHVTDPQSFAYLLTTQLREVSDDRHLRVIYSRAPLPDLSGQQQTELPPSYIEEMRRTNCGIEKAEILRGNIGYLKLNSFPDTSVCKQTAQRAMMRLNDVDSLIIDLRDNHGGFPNMVSFIAAYLFDHPEYFYNPRENITQHSWTQSPVTGSHLADKPVYLLTSARTISGAEQFSYNLKMLRRATIVGETTAGAAHAGTFHRLNEHFGIAIRHFKALNPYSKYGWEGIGVEPDIRASSANALAEVLRQVHSQQERISRNRTQPTSASR